MPGVPSIYYGSEWGITGQKTAHSDQALRPTLDLTEVTRNAPHPDVEVTIQRLAALRRASPALRYGDYHPLLIQHQQLAFARCVENEFMVIALNAADSPSSVSFELPTQGKQFVDLLNPGESFSLEGSKITLQVSANWGRILRLE
jgi:glycosidase